jgi:uncharacterized protein YjeT (DUF2065 family)
MQGNATPASASIPPPPDLKRTSLPAMLAGGLFLFATSVPSEQRKFADELLQLSEDALRSDPTVTMELGMGIEFGGVYASSYAPYSKECITFEDRLVLQFQINGGNAWAQGVTFGAREINTGKVRLLALEVANMDAVLSDQSFKVPLMLDDYNTATSVLE